MMSDDDFELKLKNLQFQPVSCFEDMLQDMLQNKTQAETAFSR